MKMVPFSVLLQDKVSEETEGAKCDFTAAMINAGC